MCGDTRVHDPPQVNVLSKMDMIEQYGELAFNLDFYLAAQGLDHLADSMEGTFPHRFRKLTQGVCEVRGVSGQLCLWA